MLGGDRMIPAGVIVSGSYLGHDVVVHKDKDGREELQFVIGVAVGISSVRVYGPMDDQIRAYKFGDPIALRVRCWAGRSGVGYSDGVLLEV